MWGLNHWFGWLNFDSDKGNVADFLYTYQSFCFQIDVVAHRVIVFEGYPLFSCSSSWVSAACQTLCWMPGAEIPSLTSPHLTLTVNGYISPLGSAFTWVEEWKLRRGVYRHVHGAYCRPGPGPTPHKCEHEGFDMGRAGTERAGAGVDSPACGVIFWRIAHPVRETLVPGKESEPNWMEKLCDEIR